MWKRLRSLNIEWYNVGLALVFLTVLFFIVLRCLTPAHAQGCPVEGANVGFTQTVQAERDALDNRALGDYPLVVVTPNKDGSLPGQGPDPTRRFVNARGRKNTAHILLLVSFGLSLGFSGTEALPWMRSTLAQVCGTSARWVIINHTPGNALGGENAGLAAEALWDAKERFLP